MCQANIAQVYCRKYNTGFFVPLNHQISRKFYNYLFKPSIKQTIHLITHWGFLFPHFTPAGAGENRLFSRHCRNGGMCTEAFVAVSYGNSNQLMKIWHIWTGSLERVVGKLRFGIRYSYVFFIFRNICISEM